MKEKRDDGGRKGIVDGRKVIKILVIKLLLETQRRQINIVCKKLNEKKIFLMAFLGITRGEKCEINFEKKKMV